MSNRGAGKLRVLVVDDNVLLADALRRRLEREPDLVCSGVISHGSVAYEKIRQITPDIVLMDIDMPEIDTFEVVKRLAEEMPDVKSLMFSGYVSPAYVHLALDCGAWGYLSKNEDVLRLIDAIRRAGRGELAFTSEVEAVLRIVPVRDPATENR